MDHEVQEARDIRLEGVRLGVWRIDGRRHEKILIR
jgi:hypothetical protein